MKRILVIEDDKSLGELLLEALTDAGYGTVWVRSSAEAKAIFAQEQFDFLVIDVGLPDESGFTVARTLQSQRIVPFLFLTAMNSAEYRLEGYELGAADYVPKPFHMRELLLRIAKVIGAPEEGGTLHLSGLVIHRSHRAIKFDDGTQVSLAGKDFELLLYLVQHRPRVISRTELQQRAVGEETHRRSIDNAVVRLRGVIEKLKPERIISVHGVGYQWVEPIE